MSWIEDVKQELDELDTSRKALGKFGILMGCILVGLAVFLSWRGRYSPLCSYISGSVGILLLVLAAAVPQALRIPYKVWMMVAFVMGWLVSRTLLMLIFYAVLTPVALTARLLKKRFLDIRFKDGSDSYWLRRDAGKRVDYEKMY